MRLSGERNRLRVGECHGFSYSPSSDLGLVKAKLEYGVLSGYREGQEVRG